MCLRICISSTGARFNATCRRIVQRTLLRPVPRCQPLSMSTAKNQPPWREPINHHGSDAKRTKLRIYNSLTREKNLFIPIDPKGEAVSWYACGPTVYDDAHLGHARNYVTTDIIRRIMRDYFGFKTKFVMNITDVDDKIILRARQQYLLNRYKASHTQLDDDLLSFSRRAFSEYLGANLKELDSTLQPQQFEAVAAQKYQRVLQGRSLTGDAPAGDSEAKMKMHIRTAGNAAKTLQQAESGMALEQFYAALDDILVGHLDRDGKQQVSSSDYRIFTDLTKRFEKHFFEDLDALNVLRPDVVTRVTEYLPQIVSFIEQIEAKGFAYATQGGDVWFDISAFEKAGNSYARLEPWNANNSELQADGEGALVNHASKKSSGDFALWKHSKEGEPSWPSKWGPGRPGWHIECSAMATDILESPETRSVDIHSGGIDLAFPHHDNEIAQSEAYYCDGTGQSHQWINYFLHMGHLSIAGSKMSKSLKNFTTIREALARGDWTPRSLRIVFLLGPWKEGIEITESLIKEGQAWESKMTNFFLKALNRAPSSAGAASDSTTIQAKLDEAAKGLETALLDSFDTRSAMQILSGFVTDLNAADQVQRLDTDSLTTAARWVTKMITIFGLNPEGEQDGNSLVGWSGIDIPEVAKPFVYPLSSLRDELRQFARSPDFAVDQVASLVPSETAQGSSITADAEPYHTALLQSIEAIRNLVLSKAAPKDLLTICDEIRDDTLWNLGVYLEDPPADAPTQTALVRPVDAELRRARLERESHKAAAAEAKAKRLESEAAKIREREEKAKIDPKSMFRTAEYSAWDPDGIPTKDAQGEDVSKAKGKKLRKEWEKQTKLYETWLKAQK